MNRRPIVHDNAYPIGGSRDRRRTFDADPTIARPALENHLRRSMGAQNFATAIDLLNDYADLLLGLGGESEGEGASASMDARVRDQRGAASLSELFPEFKGSNASLKRRKTGMSRILFDAEGEQRMSARGELDRLRSLGGKASTETESRYDRVRDHLDKSTDEVAWREKALDLVRALVRSALGDVDDDDAGGAQDMSPDSIAERICNPKRSPLNCLTRAPDPSRYVR